MQNSHLSICKQASILLEAEHLLNPGLFQVHSEFKCGLNISSMAPIIKGNMFSFPCAFSLSQLLRYSNFHFLQKKNGL